MALTVGAPGESPFALLDFSRPCGQENFPPRFRRVALGSPRAIASSTARNGGFGGGGFHGGGFQANANHFGHDRGFRDRRFRGFGFDNGDYCNPYYPTSNAGYCEYSY